MKLSWMIFGKPLATVDEQGETIGVGRAIPVFGLDALSSAAYGPEAALTILIPLGAAGIFHIVPITALILALLTIVFLSYRQTIPAYPNGGGSYTVASENLGALPGLLAGAALMVDYILTVAVGISAGIEAVTSAFPRMLPHTTAMCLIVLAMLTVVNLRGSREAGGLFAVPTYLFLGCLMAMIVVGLFKAATHGWHPAPVIAPPTMAAASASVGIWILLKAFSSGCAAMTGVEAVSNGVRSFSEPRAQTAARTLTIIVVFLMVLLGGIALVTWLYHAGAMDPDAANYQSLISILLQATLGRGWFYFVSMGSILVVLALSANTGFVDFPRLCYAIAVNRYLPFTFTLRGRRLVYSSGVYALTLVAALLLIVFRGVTDRLIPLYAVGAFTAFTLSQAGMVIHWREHREEKRWKLKAFVNGTGAVATGITTIVVLVAKFSQGAWITALVIPSMIGVMLLIHRHYVHVIQDTRTLEPLHLDAEPVQPAVIMPVGGWSKITSNALYFAMSISDEIHALHVSTEEQESEYAQQQWQQYARLPSEQAGRTAPELKILQSPYRAVIRPIMDYIDEYQRSNPDRHIAVLLPELVETHWFYYLLHNQRANGLKALLYVRGNKNVAVINVPYYMSRPRTVENKPEPGAA